MIGIFVIRSILPLAVGVGKIFFTCLGTILSMVGSGTFNASRTIAAESAGMPKLLTNVVLRRCGKPDAFHSDGHVKVEVEDVFVSGIS